MDEAIAVFSRKGIFQTAIAARDVRSREHARKLWPLVSSSASRQMVTWVSPSFENGKLRRRSHFRILPAQHTYSPKAHFDDEEASRWRTVQESAEHRRAKELVAAELARRLNAGLAMPCAVFLPGATFCRIRWHANDYGTIRWQLMVMQAGTPLDDVQRIPGVQPGARLLLHAEGDANVRAVLERIDRIEALGIAAIDVSPAYWRTLGNRLAARLPLPEYTAERHAAWLAGKALP
ncbi:DUF2840 domain-containing protein [Burkholderia vietnamiensis]|uniref:DUF2840 domain-containing protein n=1 Tax=Burkholderia vietnamiensis TaxID=60552 RepID=UPI001CF24746|nr:DUF2840 domain-containing protein [Burkholderia vietnamiensis]MCA7947274.1 DUF2840 domain-containing protein [Burkholderia vietnamiensis]MCA8232395.1 DUF2840 domain-containing protein [Burkholderia vietnamiensis]